MNKKGMSIAAGVILAISLAASAGRAHVAPTHGVQGQATITQSGVPVWVSLKSAPGNGVGAQGYMRIGNMSYKVTCALVTMSNSGATHILRASGVDSNNVPHYLLVRDTGSILRVKESATPTNQPCGAPFPWPPSPATGTFSWV